MGQVILSGVSKGMTVPSAGTPISQFAVGSTVKMNVNGTLRDFLIVHQGLPSSMYDSSCNGTWLLMKDIYTKEYWHSSNVSDYENSTIHTYLNGTFLSLLDIKIQSAIKQVKIPYRKGSGYSSIVTGGEEGLSTKIFLLSATEVSFNWSGYMPSNEGHELSYFEGCSDTGTDLKRKAYLNGTNTNWWLRSPSCNSSSGIQSVVYVKDAGDQATTGCHNSYGIRPALILPSTTKIADDGTVAA